jgi:hypothetical protein
LHSGSETALQVPPASTPAIPPQNIEIEAFLAGLDGRINTIIADRKIIEAIRKERKETFGNMQLN